MVGHKAAAHTALMSSSAQILTSPQPPLPSPPINVFIAEDSAPIRLRLIEMITELAGVHVVGEAETPRDAVAGIMRTHPDYVLLDYQLTGGTGVEVMREVHPMWPDVDFIVLTNHNSPQYRRICMEAGARSFFDKSTEFGLIKSVIIPKEATQ